MKDIVQNVYILLGGILAALVSSGAVVAQSDADADSPAGLRLFETDIRPTLVEHCYACHSSAEGTDEGGLQLDSRAGLRAGGRHGPAVVPGRPEESWLLTAISHTDPKLKMPPQHPRLSQATLFAFREWIRLGAADPRSDVSSAKPAATPAGQHWAYRPPQTPRPPPVQRSDWPLGPLDTWVLAKLEAQQLSPSPDASAAVLLRRLYFDLIGLPPTPADTQQFAADVQQYGLQSARVQLVDRLLQSPEFGPRWGRHWLDVARYAESSGKEANIAFPYAWRYRDYVLDAFNDDVPYDRFVTEQIAGDLLPYDDPRQRSRLLIATGFLAIGAKNLDEMNPQQFAADVVDEQIDALTLAVTASSVACARCHDHKSDPFSMEDYYGLAGVFHSTRTFFGTAVSPANRVGGDPLPLPRGAGQAVLHASISPARVTQLEAELQALQAESRAGKVAAMAAALSGKSGEAVFSLRDALRIFWRSGAIEGQLEKVDQQGQALPLAMGVLDQGDIVDARLHEGGDVRQLAASVPRGFPVAISPPKKSAAEFSLPQNSSGRRQLATWLTHPQHPLTTRVYVNRLWQHLLGQGLVRTVDNFGTTGEAPSHPELLDYLATRLVDQGWSTKAIVREIVLSRTYGQASAFREDAFETDPDNRLLWRMPKRRLEAEALRDAMLVASDELDSSRPLGSLVATAIGDGPIALIGLNPRLPADLDGSRHRSVYLPALRDRLPDALELFDAADSSFVSGTRENTSSPLQGLFLMNSEFLHQRSQAMMRRLFRVDLSDQQRIRLAFEICYARQPTPAEALRLTEYLEMSVENKQVMWSDVCQALLATGEFRNID